LPAELRSALTTHTIDTVMEDVSATQVRDLVAHSQPLDGLVSIEVATYIHSRGLYKSAA